MILTTTYQPRTTILPECARKIGAVILFGAAFAAVSGLGQAATLCVNAAAKSGCKPTISAAVAAASANDIINVAPGTYAESVTIGVPLTLIGADASTTIIDATGLSVGIYVDGIDNKALAGVFISGFTVQNANYEGILVTNATRITISNNISMNNNKGVVVAAAGQSCPGIPAFETSEGQDCGEGIHFMGVDHSIIIGNTSQNNSGGILLSDDTGATHDNTIAGNLVMNNPLACGITMASHVPAALTGSATALGVYQNVVVGNTISKNGLIAEGAGAGIFASAPGTASYQNLVLNNVLTGNGIPGVAIHGHTPGQNLNNNVIIGNQISGNGADVADTATPGPAGINVAAVVPITGTIISQNTISQESIDVAINAPGDFRVQRNSFAAGAVGVTNLGKGGVINADGNWWGCGANPAFGVSGFAGCATTSGGVNVTSWASAPIVK
jgi:Right handed beta helix region